MHLDDVAFSLMSSFYIQQTETTEDGSLQLCYAVEIDRRVREAYCLRRQVDDKFLSIG